MSKLLYESDEWSFDLINKAWNVIDRIAKDKFGLDYYNSQIEIVSAEQMLDAYSSIGLPSMYHHWSFGKSFIQSEQSYQKGQSNLAYELIINTDPAIAYLMENNTMTMQCLVMAHAICGHASFFKNNYLFKKWTDAEAIVDYLKYAKGYVSECEKKYGVTKVERILDAAHALQQHGVDQYKRPRKMKQELKEQKQEQWLQYLQQLESQEWDGTQEKFQVKQILDKLDALNTHLPEENLLYFIEKNAPKLKTWERELLRIVRNIAQYFYPQAQTKIMNEGWATYMHYTLMKELHREGYISDGNYMEFLDSHCGVCCQHDFDNKAYHGINPYALGFAIFKDLERIIENPTEEDKEWFPDISGQASGKFVILQEIVANYRDESFIMQYLSPKVIRDFKLFVLLDTEDKNYYTVNYTHGDEDTRLIRQCLAAQVSRDNVVPKIEVVDFDTDTNTLALVHTVADGRLLDYKQATKTMGYVHDLWQFDVELTYLDREGNTIDKV